MTSSVTSAGSPEAASPGRLRGASARGEAAAPAPGTWTDTRINAQVRDHQIATPWEFQGESELMGIWAVILQADLFADDFDVLLPEFHRLRSKDLCRYVWGHNGIGARHAIVFNIRLLDRPLHERLAALALAMIEQREEFRTGQRGTDRYRSAWVAQQCEHYGLPIARGYSHFLREFQPPFRTLLEYHGVEFVVARDPEPARRAQPPLWGCDCARFRVRQAIDYYCRACAQEVRRIE